MGVHDKGDGTTQFMAVNTIPKRLHIWNMDQLVKQEPVYDKDKCPDNRSLIESDYEDTSMDFEDSSIEFTRGQDPHIQLDIDEPCLNYQSIASPMYSLSTNTLLMASLLQPFIYDINAEKVVDIYLSHGADIEDLKVSSDLGMFATASRDTTCKLWDPRQSTAAYTLQGHSKPAFACGIASVNGVPFAWSGGSDESIKCYDLRMKTVLYELSTGNNTVHSLHFHPATQSIFAQTECLYIDRLGRKHYSDGPGLMGAMSDEEEEDWPQAAFHRNTDFDVDWDAGDHQLLQYQYHTEMEFKPERRM
eukprot:gb/GECH01004543.1/.p1 GENE.gb/GECH01004543.1/~~gb/GECH01004543.1/.p1  ORF type:complete len:304 (+),score=69.05 gb/GECH01004543.1/:1-912(+)